MIKELLVSYFRVESSRRRDVLELLARTLEFADEDRVRSMAGCRSCGSRDANGCRRQATVGLSRRRLRDMLGSLVKPPEDPDALPPVGNMGEKWVQYLIEKTEPDGDDGF